MCHNNGCRATALGLLAKQTGKNTLWGGSPPDGNEKGSGRRTQSLWPLCQRLCCTERPWPASGKTKHWTMTTTSSTTFMNLVGMKLHFDLIHFVCNALVGIQIDTLFIFERSYSSFEWLTSQVCSEFILVFKMYQWIHLKPISPLFVRWMRRWLVITDRVESTTEATEEH